MTDVELLQSLGIAGGPPPAQFSDQDVLGAMGLGSQGQQTQPAPAGPVTTPGATPAGTQDVSSAPSATVQAALDRVKSESDSAGLSVKSSGFDQGQYQKIRQTQGDLAADQYKVKSEQDAAAAVNEAPFEKANREAVAAQGEETQAKIDEIVAKGQANAKVAKLQNDFATEEAGIVAREQGEAAKAKADYLQSLNEFRASRVNPSELWDGLGRGGQFAMGVMAFAHGFLAASGKKEEGLDLFLKGIDRNIDAQIQNIKIKGESVSMFKNLWDMQRAQSASDAEARTRVRGFALESAKLAAESELSKYESGLAMSQGHAAIAKLDQELAKNHFEVFKQRDSAAAEYTRQALDKWKETVQASLRRQEIAETARHNQAMEGAKEGVPIPKVVDPDTEKPFRQFKPEFSDPKEHGKLHEQVLKDTAKMEDIMNELRKIKEMSREIHEGGGISDITNNTRLASEMSRRYDNLANNIATSEARGDIGRINFNEILMKKQGIPTELWSTRGGVDRILADTTQAVNDKVHGELVQFTDQLPPEQGGHERPYEGDYLESKYTLNPEAVPPEKAQRLEAEKGLAGPQSEQNVREEGTMADVVADHRRFRKERPDLVEQQKVEVGAEPDYSPEAIKGWEKDLTRLKELVEKNKDQTALDDIVNQAQPFLSGSNSDDPQAVYAVMMLHDLGYEAKSSLQPEEPVHETQHEQAPPKKGSK